MTTVFRYQKLFHDQINCVFFALILLPSLVIHGSLARRETKSILLDPSVCPFGWQPAGDVCVRLFFRPTSTEDAKTECAIQGAELVNIIRNQQENKALLNDLTDIINIPLEAGVAELTWLVGGIDVVVGDPQLSYNLWMSVRADDKREKSFVLQRQNDKHFELVTVSVSSLHPFICALLPLTRQALLYEQALLPKNAPQIIENPKQAYHYANRPKGFFVTIPCKVSGNPTPHIKWFKSYIEEIDVESSNSSYIVSGGSLLIPINHKYQESATYHCTGSNSLGTVRSTSTIVRSAFIKSFRRNRLDVYPINPKGTGTRIECQSPQHYPKSYTYSWMQGDRTDHFVSQSERVFISMDGTLYFSYNKKEDASSYACSLSLPTIQSGHYGPFFKLVLSQSLSSISSPPRIDEFQPQIFPEIPIRGQAVFIECFAYGFPNPQYKWSRVDGKPLSKRHRIQNYGRILKIDAVTVDDAVRYKCVASNEHGRQSAEIQLNINSPPILLQPLVQKRVAINTNVTFECLISNRNSGQVSIEWFHDAQPLAPLLMPASDRHRFKIHSQVLSIFNALERDSGIYQCVASNDIGSVSSSARLSVENSSPKFHANIFPRRVFIVEGTKLTLPCFYDASPQGFSRWYSSSRASALSNNVAERMHQLKVYVGDQKTISILKIKNASKTDEGAYYCETSNGVGEGRGTVYVHVVPKPHLVVKPSSLSSGIVADGTYATPNKITCEVELACELPIYCPEALFNWQFNERDLHNVITQESPLKPKYYEKEIIDNWRRTRSSKRWIFINSEHNESPEEHLLKTHKHIRQISELEISPSFSSANIGRFACNSIYGSASSEMTEHEVLNATPTQLKIIRVQKNSVKISWKRPANQKRRESNSKIDGYLIEYRTETDRQWRSFPNGVFKTQDRIIGSYLLKDLQPNQKYQFRIRTRAVDGLMSVPSAHSEWVETPPSPPKDPIQKLRWRIIDNDHLLLEWDPVELMHPSGSNLKYNVSWSDKSQTDGRSTMDSFVHFELVSQPNIVIVRDKTHTIDSNKKLKIQKYKDKTEVADKCFTINISIQPLNDVGIGSASTVTAVHISTEGPKRIPDNLVAIPVNATHLNLTWEWKNVDECENVIGAQISCIEKMAFMKEMFFVNNTMDSDYNTTSISKMSPEHITEIDALTVNQSVPAYYTSWLVHDLKPGTDYSCTVRAFDQYGRYGNKSTEAASAVTLDPAPSVAPEITRIRLQETANGYTTLIEWTAVPLRNSLYNDITDRQRGYKILIYVSETAEKPITLVLTEAELQNPRKPSARIDGLKLMYFYTIKVAGFNEGGVGPISKPMSIRLGMSSNLNSATAANVVSKFIMLFTIAVFLT